MGGLTMGHASTQVDGLIIFDRDCFIDERGAFFKIYDAKLVKEKTLPKMSQVNYVENEVKGTVRGLHFQVVESGESKFISVIKGRIWDVVVDLRPESSTYLAVFAIELSRVNQTSLLIPPGCAHGYQTLSSKAAMIYCHDISYDATKDRGIRYNDPDLNIQWPITISKVSKKDKCLPFLKEFGLLDQ
jgi:dTDP-4-dehydrorhamnose 3,5-epimerase